MKKDFLVLGLLGGGLLTAYLGLRESRPVPLPSLPLSVARNFECHDLPLSQKAGQVWHVQDSGSFCLAEDFLQPTLWGAGHSLPRYGHALVRLSGGEVTVDLQGHHLLAESLSDGMVAENSTDKEIATRFGLPHGTDLKSVTIKNGFIDLQGRGDGIVLVDHWSASPGSTRSTSEATHHKTSHVLENLVIRTRGRSIILEGRGNVIRNCIIESSGNAAIVVMGPDNVVENNRIVLAPRWERPRSLLEITRQYPVWEEDGPGTPPRAALVLQEASNSRISGNNIEVANPSAKRVAILIRDESKAVEIKDNVFVGPSEIGSLSPGATVLEAGNRFVSR